MVSGGEATIGSAHTATSQPSVVTLKAKQQVSRSSLVYEVAEKFVEERTIYIALKPDIEGLNGELTCLLLENDHCLVGQTPVFFIWYTNHNM